jgi:hypothetical protein
LSFDQISLALSSMIVERKGTKELDAASGTEPERHVISFFARSGT